MSDRKKVIKLDKMSPVPATPADVLRQGRGYPLGWQNEGRNAGRIGFDPGNVSFAKEKLLRYDGDGHILAIAPTGAGKGRGCVIPALLTHPGATFTVDVKGEAFHATARRRREMGHTVVAFDPFGEYLSKGDTLNPLDLMLMPGAASDADCELLAELLAGGFTLVGNDQFWERNGKGMLVGTIGLTAEHPEVDKRNMGTVLDYMYADDVDYSLAVQMDTHKFKNKLARQELAAYLQHESEKCRPSIRSTAQCILKCLGSEAVRKFLSRTSFDLMSWFDGGPIDIFLLFSPDKLESHRPLLRLILGTLLTILSRRKTIPEHRTLLLLDEIAQCGQLSHLRTALTLLRGYGVQVMTLWQDMSQLKALYPLDWETILNNSGVIQAFGIPNGLAAKTIGELMDMHVSDLLAMGRDQQALLIPGQRPQITRRVDYLVDACFKGMFDPNPRYAKVKPE
jgi:type IV secretion system protein VirD4